MFQFTWPPGWTGRHGRALASFAQLGTALFGCVVIGLALGYFADRWLGTQPVAPPGRAGLRDRGGRVNLFRALRALNRMNDGNNGN